MAEDQKSDSNFKVVDRRPFREDGTVRQHTSEEERSVHGERLIGGKPSAPRRPAASASGPPRPAATAPRETEFDELSAESASGFETLISYLSTTAMFQLGLLPGPSGERIPVDLENARRTIDMLEVLQDKTQGNLTAEESKLLEDVLYELRMSCVEVERRHAKKAK